MNPAYRKFLNERKKSLLKSLSEEYKSTVYLKKDFIENPDYMRAIEAAKQLWRQRVEEYVSVHGDNIGSCVVGAGISIYIITSGKCKYPKLCTIIQAPDHYQGSLSWEYSVKEIIANLKEAGIDSFYKPGSMD